MSSDMDYIFKIGIVGPTRVGKTSLIASILNDSQRLLEGTPVSMRPHGPKTERRVAQHHKELSGSIRAGEFHPGAVSGTEESFKYELDLDPGTSTEGIRLCLMDYPGGWIDSTRRPEEREAEWDICKQWMKDSSVLIVPVESAVMMEASSSRHRKAIPFILNTYDVEQVARAWAKDRARCPDEPALLIFCPVKCESYFADNGGLTDSSLTLFHAFEDHYRDVLKAVKGEAPQVKIIYAPVDTVGCVEIIKANWRGESQTPADMIFSADYRVRRPGHQAVKGAGAVLVSLCRHLVDAKRRSEAGKADASEDKAWRAKREAEKDEGFFGNIWLWASRERQRRRERAAELSNQANGQKRVVEDLDETIDRLATYPFGARVREL
jgi:hypothetical protein